MYMALTQCAVCFYFAATFNWVELRFHTTFILASTVTASFASLAVVVVLWLHYRFVHWPISRQMEFLYSLQSKQAMVIGVAFASILMLLPIILAGPVILAPGGGGMAIFMPGMFMAMAIWTSGRHYREGTSVHCASCDYEQGLPPDGEDMSPKCPECGKQWLVRGATVIGRPAPDRSFIIASVFCIAISLGLFSMQFGGISTGTANPVMSMSSTASLIRVAMGGELA